VCHLHQPVIQGLQIPVLQHHFAQILDLTVCLGEERRRGREGRRREVEDKGGEEEMRRREHEEMIGGRLREMKIDERGLERIRCVR
jgi:hypothetical protein